MGEQIPSRNAAENKLNLGFLVVHADEKLTAFLELEAVTRAAPASNLAFTKSGLATQFAPQSSHAEQSAAEERNCRAAIRDRGTQRPDLEREVLVR
jgi:hypothetical protein